MALFGLFRPKCPVEPHEWEWILASLKWLEEEFPHEDEPVSAGAIILPTPDNFPPLSGTPEERAALLFEHVKQYADLADWPTELVRDEDDEEERGNSGFAVPRLCSDILGSFDLKTAPDGSAIGEIIYHPALLDDPASFVATTAHELAHYLLSTASRIPPGGPELEELVTDVATVWLGFGIFAANDAKKFEGFTDYDRMGWRNEERGYLHERGLLTTMALCAALRGDDARAALLHLKRHLATDLKSALRFIETRNIQAEMAAIDLVEFGVIPVGQDST